MGQGFQNGQAGGRAPSAGRGPSQEIEFRSPKEPGQITLDAQCDPTGASGGPIEPWVYGPPELDALGGIRAALALRASLGPYLRAQVDLLATDGQPFMRPIWYDFPATAAAAAVEDQFMFGPEFMVAPVLEQGATERAVLFPGDPTTKFRHYFSGVVHQGGTTAPVPVVSLDTFPLFVVVR